MPKEEPHIPESLSQQGWVTAQSRSTGLWYWFNTRTNVATYEPPNELGTISTQETEGAATPGDDATYSPLSYNQNSETDGTHADFEASAFSTDHTQDNENGYTSVHKPAEEVRDKYESLKQQTREERMESPIYHLRNFNNWIKSVLIQEYSPKPCNRVLDLACGKFGDLRKWVTTGMLKYVGLDISYNQVNDAKGRYNGHMEKISQKVNPVQHHQFYQEAFVAKFAVADLGSVDLNSSGLFDDRHTKSTNWGAFGKETFNAISMQFALHYLFESETTALRFFQNIAGRLSDDGVFIGTIPDANVIIRRLRNLPDDVYEFGNDIYKVKFTPESKQRQWHLGSNPFGVKYTFWLQDQVESIDEYLVPLELLELLASMAGMELVASFNFADFFSTMLQHSDRSKRASYRDLLRILKVMDEDETISQPEWEAVGLYRVFCFQRSKGQQNRFKPKGSTKLEPIVSRANEVPLFSSFDLSFPYTWIHTTPPYIPYRSRVKSAHIYDIIKCWENPKQEVLSALEEVGNDNEEGLSNESSQCPSIDSLVPLPPPPQIPKVICEATYCTTGAITPEENHGEDVGVSDG